MKTGILNVALDWDFQFLPIDERDKKLEFSRLGSVRLIRDSLVDQSMLFANLYLIQGEKIETWFVSPASKEYFGVEFTAFLSANKFTKKIYLLVR